MVFYNQVFDHIFDQIFDQVFDQDSQDQDSQDQDQDSLILLLLSFPLSLSTGRLPGGSWENSITFSQLKIWRSCTPPYDQDEIIGGDDLQI